MINLSPNVLVLPLPVRSQNLKLFGLLFNDDSSLHVWVDTAFIIESAYFVERFRVLTPILQDRRLRVAEFYGMACRPGVRPGDRVTFLYRDLGRTEGEVFDQYLLSTCGGETCHKNDGHRQNNNPHEFHITTDES